MLPANTTALFDRMGVIAGIGIFDVFDSCDLDLDPMTFTYEFDS